MEIISYVLDGALEHRDSMGNGSVIKPGDVQRMSAGTGVRHSEYNASKEDPVHFLQIWIAPEQKGLRPSYEEKPFAAADKRGRLCLVGSRDGADGSVRIHQDVNLYATVLSQGDVVRHEVPESRGAWVQVIRGAFSLNGAELKAGDAASVTEAGVLELIGEENDSEALLFDLKL